MARKRGQNEGSIYQRADGRWVAAITVPGTQQRVFRYGKTRVEARQKLKVLLSDLDAGVQVGRPAETLQTYLLRWLQTIRPTVRERTWEGYESIVRVRILPHLGTTPIRTLTPDMVQALYAVLGEQRLSAHSIRRTHAVLHRAMGQAVRWKLLAHNPTDAAQPPRAAREEMRTLAREETSTLIDGTHGRREHALYVVAVSAGLRLGELLGLRWSDIDLDGARLVVQRTLQRTRDAGLVFAEPKTGKSRRTVLLSKRAVQALREHRILQIQERLASGPAWQEQNLVFPNTTGGPADPGSTSAAFGATLKRLALPSIRFHDLRHTCATLLLGQGVHAKVVSEMLGHSSIVITMDTYSHVVPVMHADAAHTMDRILGS